MGDTHGVDAHPNVAVTIHELNTQIRAKDAKYKILQSIVEAQDHHITELEERLCIGNEVEAREERKSERSDDGSVYWRTEYERLRELLEQEKQQSKSETSKEVTALEHEIDRLQSRYEHESNLWNREKQTLLKLLDRSQATASKLENTLFEERKEMERRIKSDVRVLTMGAGESTHVVQESLRKELECANERTAELRRQLVEANTSMEEQRSEFLELLEKEKQCGKQERKVLQTEVQSLVETLQQKNIEVSTREQEWQVQIEKLRKQSLSDKQRHVARITELEEQVKTTNENVLLYSRGSSSSSDNTENANTSNQVHGNQAVVMMPKAMRAEFEERLMDVLKAKEQTEARLHAERKTLLEDVEKHDIHRDRRIAVLTKDASSRLTEERKFLELMEKRQQFLELELQKCNNRVLRAENSAKEREAMAYAELQETVGFYESQMDDLKHALTHTMETNKNYRKSLQDKHNALLQCEKAYTEQIQSLIDNVKLLEKSQSSRGTNNARKAISIEAKKLEATQKELRDMRVIYAQCQQELDQSQHAFMTQQTELQTKLATQSDLAIQQRQEYHDQIESFRDETRLLRKAMETANAMHSQAEVLAMEEIERLKRKVDEGSEWAKGIERDCAIAIKSAEAAATGQAAVHQEHTSKLRNLLSFVQQDFESYRKQKEEETSRLKDECERLRTQQRETMELLHQKEEIHRKFAVAEKACRVVLEKSANRANIELAGEKQRREELDKRTREGCDLVASWAKRQQSVSFERERLEQELSEALSELADSNRAKDMAVEVVVQEVTALRSLQDKHLQDLEATRQLGEAGQLRLRAEIDAIERRVAVAEDALKEEHRGVEAERKALSEVNAIVDEVIQQREQSIANNLVQSQKQLQHAEEKLEAYLVSMQEQKQHVSSQLEAISGISRRHDEAAQTTRSALFEQLSATKELATEKLRHSHGEVEKYKSQARQSRKMADNTMRTAEKELRSLHGELRHLRLKTTENQLLITREKQVLVEEVEKLKQEANASLDQTKKAFEARLKLQKEGKLASDQELSELEEKLSEMTCYYEEQSAEKDKAHQREVSALQQGLSILRAMEKEREETTIQEMETLRKQLGSLQSMLNDRQVTESQGVRNLRKQLEELRDQISHSEELLHDQRCESKKRRESLLERLNRASATARGHSSLKSMIPGRRRSSLSTTKSALE